MVVPEYVRPILLIVIGWFMGTHQMIRKHSNAATSELLLLHPAYCFFYTMFAGAVFVLLFQKDDKQGNADISFGFLADPANARGFFVRAVAVLAAQTLAAYVYAWLHRPKTEKIKNAKDMRAFVARYAFYSLAAGIAAFACMVLLDYIRGGINADESAK